MRAEPREEASRRTLRTPSAVALLPGEPAGRICTVSAGAVSFEAILSGRPGGTLPPPALPDPGPNVRHHALREDGDRDGDGDGDGEAHHLSGEVRAVRPDDLAVAVDGLLRALSAHAALAQAVLETRVVRLCEPLVPDALLVGRLARELRRSSGLGVSFGPSWHPAPEAAICVGARGREKEIEHLLREHPAWQTTPR